MVDDFIKFMKEHRAWVEFLKEVQEQSGVSLNGKMLVLPFSESVSIEEITKCVNDVRLRHRILEDGHFFFYADATTLVDWFELDIEWRELWKSQQKKI